MADSPTEWLLHDERLLNLSVDWKTGHAELGVSYWPDERHKIVAEELRMLTAPRQFPWGMSTYIFSTHGPIATPEGFQLLRIQLQSGDEIELVAKKILMPPERARNDDPSALRLGTSN